MARHGLGTVIYSVCFVTYHTNSRVRLSSKTKQGNSARVLPWIFALIVDTTRSQVVVCSNTYARRSLTGVRDIFHLATVL